MRAATVCVGVALVGVRLAGALAATGTSAESGAAPAPAPAPVWTCHDDVCQRATQRGERLTIELLNRRVRPTWVVVEPFDLSNVRILGPSPFLLELRAGETKTAGILAIQDTTRPFAYQAKWKALAGNPNAVHDDTWRYRMPFGGTSPVRISQGYDGPFTHRGLGANALDFPLPIDTPILAARGGTIVEVASDRAVSGSHSGAGQEDGDHRVVIEHSDGTFSLYAHLRPGSPVGIGDHVESGDLIGHSGDTGNATGPHLHFEVYKIDRDGQRQTIPVKFWDGTGRGFTPHAGVEYAPGCPRVGPRTCRPGELAIEPAFESLPAAPAATR